MKKDIRIMVVDDDEMIRECIIAFLEDEDFQVFAASSAEEGLDAIASVHPTVCITDLRLPGMNGEMFIQNAHLLSPGTHFMIHTGSAYILADELRVIGMTTSDILHKPVHDLSTISGRIMDIAAKAAQQ
jgi:DNA-binding NtrC family response regulator